MNSHKWFHLLLASTLVLSACAGNKDRLVKGKTLDGEVVEAEGMAPYNELDLPGTKAAALAAAQRGQVAMRRRGLV